MAVEKLNSSRVLNIAIHGVVGGDGIASSTIMKQLEDQSIDIVMLDLNTPGGSVFEGFSIMNALKQHPAKVHGKVSGVCASIGSVILMGCDTIEMTKNSMLMIHMPTITTQGNAEDLRKEASLLDRMQQNIMDAYRSKLNKECDLLAMLEKETWLTPEEAKDIGFCDIISDTTPKLINYFDFSRFNYRNCPELVLNLYDKSNKPKEPDLPLPISEFEKLINKLKDIFQLKRENTMPNRVKNQEMPEEEKVEVEVNAPKEEEEVEPKKNVDEEIIKQMELLINENIDLKRKIGEFEKTKALDEEKLVEKEQETFVENLVASGQIRPTDVSIHVESLVSRYGNVEKMEAYKAMLSSLPVSVEMRTHFANKVTAPETGDPKSLDTAAQALHKKYRAEGNTKVTLGDCYREAHKNIG